MSALALLALAAFLPAAQETGPTEFEVAVIKPYTEPPPQQTAGRKAATSLGMRGGPETSDPGQMIWNGSLQALILTAYRLRGYDLEAPAWLSDRQFSITAKVPAGATREEALLMWQKLLADRFLLKIHRAPRPTPVYELVVAKNGPKFKPPAPGGGCPKLPPGRTGVFRNLVPGHGFQICATGATIASLITTLTGFADRPLLDATKLDGRYDFELTFLSEAMNPDAMAAPYPPLAEALRSQLGLALAPQTRPIDTLIVDRIEKNPSSN